MTDLKARLSALLDDDEDVQPLASIETPIDFVSETAQDLSVVVPTPEMTIPETAPLEIKIEAYNEDPPVFKAKPAEIKAWAHWRHWHGLWRFLNEFNQRNYGDVQDYKFLYSIGYDRAKHRAIFALDDENYYAIDFDEKDEILTPPYAANCVLIRLRLIGQEFYRLNRRPLRVEVVKPPETDTR